MIAAGDQNDAIRKSAKQTNHPINKSFNPPTITQSPNHPITRLLE